METMPQIPEALPLPADAASMESKYRTHLFSDALAQYFPRFVQQLKGQRDGQKANWGRACVFEFSQGTPTTITKFDSPEQLRGHLLKPRGGSRRLCLLEDISLNWITILGAHFRIHPSFFASHWADPTGADFNGRHAFFSDPKRRFILKYPRFQLVTVQGLNGDWKGPVLAMECNAERCFFPSSGDDTTYENPHFSRTNHNLSFWGNQLSPWDAVLLVDPPLRSIILLDPSDCPSKRLVVKRLTDQNPCDPRTRSFYPSINEDYDDWNTPRPTPELTSVYEDMINCCSEWEHEVDSDPKSCTKFCRKLVIGFWLDFVRRRYTNMITASELSSVKPTKTGYVNWTGWLNKNLNFPTEEKIPRNLVNAHHKQAALFLEMWANMRALHLPLPGGDACGPEVQDAWERQGWNEVHHMANHIANMMKLLTQDYQHSVTMKETQTANKVGRSVARITNLAMTFTPMSAIAAIFSMSGPFALGENRWWVFWVICFPVILLIFFLFFSGKIKATFFSKSQSPGKGKGSSNASTRIFWLNRQKLDVEKAEQSLGPQGSSEQLIHGEAKTRVANIDRG